MVNLHTSSELEMIGIVLCIIIIISLPIGLFIAIISPSKHTWGTDTRSNGRKFVDFIKDILFGAGISMFLLCFLVLMSCGDK